MDAPLFTGDDTRDLSHQPRSVAATFWRSFDFAARTGAMTEFLSIYRPMPAFVELVAEADRRLADRQRGAA